MKKILFKLITSLSIFSLLTILFANSVWADKQEGPRSTDRREADKFFCNDTDHPHTKTMKELHPPLQPITYYVLCTNAVDDGAQDGPLGTIHQPAALGGFGTGEEGIARFIRVIIGILVVTAVILAFVFLLIGGIGFITAGGDKAKVESARARIIWAVVGLAIVFAAFAIITFVESIFGVSIISGNFDIPGV